MRDIIFDSIGDLLKVAQQLWNVYDNSTNSDIDKFAIIELGKLTEFISNQCDVIEKEIIKENSTCKPKK